MTHPHLTTADHRTPSTLATRVARIVSRAWNAYWDWRARQATVQILLALDSRTLRDIGLSRGEIESVVYGRHGERRMRYDENWRTGA